MTLTLKDFTRLTNAEKELIWRERNKESIRTKMYNADIIPLESHMAWVSSLPDRHDCKYFLVCFDEKPVGVIDFTGITEDSCEIGDYVFEDYLNLGYGIVFEDVILRYAFEQLKVQEVHCAVLETNKNVLDTHVKYFGFAADEQYSSVKQTGAEEFRFNGLSLLKSGWQNWHNPIVERSFKFFKVERILFD